MSASTQIDEAADAADAAIEQAEKRFSALAERIEKLVQESLETLRARSRTYADTAGEQLDTAQRYVVDHVQERPLTSTLAALGVGVLIGLVIGGGRNR